MYWAAKLSDVGESTTGTIALPLNTTDCGEVGALSLMLSVPGCDPVAVAVRLTAIVQFAPAARVVGDTGQLVPAELME